MKKILLLTALIFIFSNCNNDDDPIEPFKGVVKKVHTLGGSSNDTLEDIKSTTDGGYVCVGYTQSTDGSLSSSPAKGLHDYWIVKYNANNEMEFNKTYGGSSEDRAKSVVQTDDGGYLLSGFTESNDFDVSENFGQKDFWLVKLDISGNLQWQKSIGFGKDDEGFSIIKTKDGGYFTCGYLDVSAPGAIDSNGRNSNNSLHGIGEFWGIKLDKNGNIEWRKYFGGNMNDRAYDAIQTANGDFILVGAAESEEGFDITDPKGSYDYWVIRINSEGEKIWQKSYGGSDAEECYNIIKTNDNNFLIIGKTLSTDQDASGNHGSFDTFVIKISQTGNIIWKKTFGGNQFDSAFNIIALNDGNYMMSGTTRSDDVYDLYIINEDTPAQNDAILIKIDANGTVLETFTYGGTKLDFAIDLIQKNDNTIMFVGTTSSNDYDISDFHGFTDATIFELR